MRLQSHQVQLNRSHLQLQLLLLLLSRFRVRLCATPQMAAHQAPPSLGFSRQEHWSGCHFLLLCMKVKSESEVAQSCPTLSDPMDCSLPGSSVHRIFQAEATTNFYQVKSQGEKGKSRTFSLLSQIFEALENIS